MKYSEQALATQLQQLLASNIHEERTTDDPLALWVAYSGGLDSHVLLHSLSQLLSQAAELGLPNFTLHAIHINHHISANALIWQQHCQHVCDVLGVTLTARSVHLDSRAGQGLESAAREARYAIFDKLLRAHDFLLMAHHQDDQIETMLFRLLRGAGPRGLASIPVSRTLARGYLLRPLLTFSREDLETYANSNHLSWVEDESNLDTTFDRNFLRHKIIPQLKHRWPALGENWQRSAILCAEAEHLQKSLAQQDLLTVLRPSLNCLDIQALQVFDKVRQGNVLREWFVQLRDHYGLPEPGYHQLTAILDEVLPAALDANPLVTWSNTQVTVQIRRFNQGLYALKPVSTEFAGKALSWCYSEQLFLAPGLGSLSMVEGQSKGIDPLRFGDRALTVRFRQGGEQVKEAGRKTRSLKKIFQDYQVPSWLRDKVPLLYLGDELIAVADLFICENWQENEAPNLVNFCWHRADIYCGF